MALMRGGGSKQFDRVTKASRRLEHAEHSYGGEAPVIMCVRSCEVSCEAGPGSGIFDVM
jgi:hypothetical protein